MAVMVKKTKENRYKVYSVMTPSGERFVLPDKANAEGLPPVASPRFASASGGVDQAIRSASENSVADAQKNVKGQVIDREEQFKYSAEADTQQDMEAETLRKSADLMPGVKRRDLQAIMSDIKGGAIEAQLMADFWDQYDNIRVANYTAEAQELQEVKRALQGRKIYADESLKAEFGDDWNGIRKKAFGTAVSFILEGKKINVKRRR